MNTPARSRHSWLTYVAIAIVILATAGAAFQTAQRFGHSYTKGVGYRHEWWRNSQLMARLQTVPKDRRLFSNAPDAVYVWTGRSSTGVPQRRRNGGSEEFFRTELGRVRSLIKQASGAVAYFHRPTSRQAERYNARVEEVIENLQLRVVEEFPDGVLLQPRKRHPATAPTH